MEDTVVNPDHNTASCGHALRSYLYLPQKILRRLQGYAEIGISDKEVRHLLPKPQDSCKLSQAALSC